MAGFMILHWQEACQVEAYRQHNDKVLILDGYSQKEKQMEGVQGREELQNASVLTSLHCKMHQLLKSVGGTIPRRLHLRQTVVLSIPSSRAAAERFQLLRTRAS